MWIDYIKNCFGYQGFASDVRKGLPFRTSDGEAGEKPIARRFANLSLQIAIFRRHGIRPIYSILT